MIFRILHWASRLLLAGIFLYSGYVKQRSPLQFAAAIAGYNLVPASLVLPLASYLPWAEVALGIFLLTGWKSRHAGLVATGLLVVFLSALTITYARGIDADCGCFASSERISPRTITRDGLLLLPAVFLAIGRPQKQAPADKPL